MGVPGRRHRLDHLGGGHPAADAVDPATDSMDQGLPRHGCGESASPGSLAETQRWQGGVDNGGPDRWHACELPAVPRDAGVHTVRLASGPIGPDPPAPRSVGAWSDEPCRYERIDDHHLWDRGVASIQLENRHLRSLPAGLLAAACGSGLAGGLPADLRPAPLGEDAARPR